jgi:hypothetical protein
MDNNPFILGDSWSMFFLLQVSFKSNILYFVIILLMDSFLAYVPLISLMIVGGLFVVAIVNFSILRKNLKMQSEQWIKNLKMQVNSRFIPE